MHSRDHGSLNGRPRHQESLRPSYHHLTYKRSVEDYFLGINGPPSRLLPTPSPSKPIQKSKTVGPSIARALNPSHPDAIQHSEGAEKKLKSRSQSSKHTFRWMKGELIGSGSHGRVFIALNVTTGELMAVKQVELPRTASDRMKNDLQNFVETLRDERDTLKDLDHANIVQYLGFEENPETVNIFLQYVSGGTIDNCLREYGKFQEGVTKSFTRQILEGLSYLHANGILHRDLKSANILVEPSGICKISDFGISKRLVEVDRTYSVMKGTSYWMAPEAIFNEGAGYDSKVDIWSVGCILLEMWTAKRPWYDEPDFLPVIFKLLRDKLPPPLPEDLGLSESAEHFRRGCFHPDPAQRSSADMLLTHPYLILPETWSFPGICDIGYRAATNSSPAIEIAQIAEVLSHSLDMNVTDSFQRSSSPALTMNSGTLATISTQINPPRTISPPLVIVAPPPPRKLTSPDKSVDWVVRNRSPSVTSESSGSQQSIQLSASSRAKRQLVIHNPDTVPDFTRPKKRDLPEPPKPQAFVYHPPPLPDIGGEVPYSTQLAPLPQARFAPPAPHKHVRTASAKPSKLAQEYLHPPTLSPPTIPVRVGPANLKAAMAQHPPDDDNQTFSDSDSYFSTSSSTWKKPPINIATSPRRRPSLPTTPFQQAKSTEMPTTQKRSPVFAGPTRPDNREVLQHMKVYFPDHDLDEPIVEDPLEPSFSSSYDADIDSSRYKRFTMKSIKTIAEEQIHRFLDSPDKRRQTRLWDGNIEEIKAPK